MKVSVLGAAGEVGRSAFMVESGPTRALLDYGVMFGRRGDPPQYPTHVKPRDIAGAVISHAHLDHSGNVPALFAGGGNGVGVHATRPTMELSRLLIEDMIKIEKGRHEYDLPEVNAMMDHATHHAFGEPFGIGGLRAELRESGHVVGGSTVIVEADGRRLFYTGDVNVRGSRMLREADLDVGDVDLLITESTYALKDQAPRKESEAGLLEFAKEVMDRKGILFIPSFSVERSQEIACVLRNANFGHRVIMDGMALKVNKIIMDNMDYLRDPKVFEDAVGHAISIRSHEDRKRNLEGPCVVISPAGMLVGGNAVFYLQEIAFDDRNGIALVSYQGEGTPGRKLLETGKVQVRGGARTAAAQVKKFEFSGHSGRTDLFEMVRRIKGSPKVVTVHGDPESCETFAREIHEKFGLDAHAAVANETIEV